MKRWIVRLISALVLVAVMIPVGGAVSALNRLPDLQPWHRLLSRLEPRAGELATFSLDDYLRREDAVFLEVKSRVEAVVSRDANPSVPNRYVRTSRSHPSRLPTDWNRTQSLAPAQVRGGALLIHGLTDSPYSMRAVAERLQAEGYYTLSLRMQGHGTVPGGLVDVTWEDWLAAVRMGARHVRKQIGEGRPLVMVGYSNGGALVTKYSLDVAEGADLPAPSKIILLSPMIGVSPTAWLARAISRLGAIPFFEKARWLDVVPEYNPFKYNSFPTNAGFQTARLTAAVREQVTRLESAGALTRLAPILTFQSVIDATVSTPAVVHDLFDHLPAGGHELVLLDINRSSGIEPFLRPGEVLPRLLDGGPRRYTATLITNSRADTNEVSAMSVAAGSTVMTTEALMMSWPPDVFSLSHVAIPFPEDDSVYGGASRGREEGSVSLGRVSVRGEKGVLIVPQDVLMRLTWNPFFAYLAARVEAWAAF
jgi:alpha-beta hydrolase superfamily lysophospholipase